MNFKIIMSFQQAYKERSVRFSYRIDYNLENVWKVRDLIAWNSIYIPEA